MNESDFDALCEGMSGDEVKRLRKILVSWSIGLGIAIGLWLSLHPR